MPLRISVAMMYCASWAEALTAALKASFVVRSFTRICEFFRRYKYFSALNYAARVVKN